MKHRILLADDETAFVLALGERLSLRGFDPLVVHDGADALDALRKEDIPLMVLDLRMPGVDGIEVLKGLREAGAKTRVVVLTGHGTAEDRERCNAYGAVAFFNKPVNIEVLAQTLRDAAEGA
jgi:DNA-binding response OmpR family regulator